MLQAWLIYGERERLKNTWYIEEYIKEGKKLGIHVELIIAEQLEIGIKNGTWYILYEKRTVPYPDFAIVRTIYPLLNRQLELLKIPTFNNSKVAEICNDKARTYQYIAKLGIPMVETVFIRNNELFLNLDEIFDNTVIKSVSGHGGTEVFLVNEETKPSVKTSMQYITSDFVKQPLTGTRHQDLRVYVLGKEILACILRTANDGFKSNFSLGGSVCEYQLSRKEQDIVSSITDMFEFGLVGIDFIIGDDGTLIFNEIEDVVGARMLYQCTNINLVERYLVFIKNTIKDMLKN